VKTGDESAAVCAHDRALAIDQPPRRQISSAELFKGQREVLIEHAGEVYSLRHTSKGKLILTK